VRSVANPACSGSLLFFCEERAEEIRAHAGVKILADLEMTLVSSARGSERVRRFGFRVIEMSECEEIWRVHMFRRLNGDACGGNGFGQDSLGKFCGEGTAAAAVVGCEPGGTVPLMVIVTVPSALVAGSEISRSDLDSAGRWLRDSQI